MSVRQIVKIGEKSDPEGAVCCLVGLAKGGNQEAIRALKGAARAAKYKPQCTFSAAAKNFDIKKIAPNSVGQGRARTAVSSRETAPGHTNYSQLTKLLKVEHRGRTNPVREDTNLLAWSNIGSEEDSLTIVQFHKTLEEKGVAEIAITWFTELEKCELDTSERIKLQTGLVKVLEGLNCNSIHALEELRKSRTSNTSKEVFDFLTGDIQLDDQSVKRLGELNRLFP
ncbi:MAG: hypothetical protein RIN53_02925, partial [Gammaproteobacteria bacterium]